MTDTIETKTAELEVMPPDEKLVKFAEKTGLEITATSNLVEAFRPIFSKAKTAITAAQGVAESVKDATCVREIKKSRECRLAIRAVRLESEKTRVAQKQHALLYGKAVDGFHNILIADLSPVETALQEAEDTAERAESARLAALKAAREAELQPLVEYPLTGLEMLSETQYGKMLSDAKLLRQAKLDAIAKAEAEAKAKAEADRVERERIAAENARLKAEAEAREAAAKAEREEAARKLAAEQAAAKAAQEAAEKVLAAERAAAEAAAKAAAEKARKEREAIEAKAKAEREAAEAKAKAEFKAAWEKATAERAAAEALSQKEIARQNDILREERKKALASEAAAKAQRDAEAKRQAEAADEKAKSEAAAKKAAAAPDNAKAQSFAAQLRAMRLPEFKTSKAFALLPSKIEALAKWIEGQIKEGELL